MAKGKKTLGFLLAIPLAVGILTWVGIEVLHREIEVDISDISWEYGANEGFLIETEHELKATPVNNSDYPLSPGNDLIWKVTDAGNTNVTIEEVANAAEETAKWILKTGTEEGNAIITCQNEKGSKDKSFQARIFASGGVVITPIETGKLSLSGNSAYTDGLTFGEYDLAYEGMATRATSYTKVRPVIELSAKVVGGVNNNVFVSSKSDNLEVNGTNVTIKGAGKSFVTFASEDVPDFKGTYEFMVIENGVNVYSYDDLLLCTNYSENGEVVVMQTSLGSVSDVNGNPEGKETFKMFGHIQEDGEFTFKPSSGEPEYHVFESTYNTEYIDQYNAFIKDPANASIVGNDQPVSKDLIAGIRFLKDVHGNGHTINAHNLSFPWHSKPSENEKIPLPGEKDLFKGPVPLFFLKVLGANEELAKPFGKAYGQDNCGFMAMDNVKIDDIVLRNGDNASNLYDFTYAGTVLEVNGVNVAVTNSQLSHGKNIIRSFSSDNFHLENAILKNGAEFLLYLGSNEYNKPNDTVSTVSINNQELNGEKFFNGKADLELDRNGGVPVVTDLSSMDGLYNYALFNNFTGADKGELQGAINATKDVQNALDNPTGLPTYKATVNNVAFHSSGVYSIAFDALFNGGFLYNSAPSGINELFSSFGFDLFFNEEPVGGTSAPVELTLIKPDFFDFSSIDDMDFAPIFEENFSAILKLIGGEDKELNLDDYFPIKKIIRELNAQSADKFIYSHTENETTKDYVSTNILWFGGGLNNSSVKTLNDNGETIDYGSLHSPHVFDTARYSLEKMSINESRLTTFNNLITIMSRAIAMAIGSNPFQTIINDAIVDNETPENFNKSPKVRDYIPLTSRNNNNGGN